MTVFIHGTELMRFGKVTLRSTKISIQWLWPVKVILKVMKRRPKVFCWSCDEGPLKWEKQIFRATSLPARIEWAYSRPLHQMVGQCLHVIVLFLLLCNKLYFFACWLKKPYKIIQGPIHFQVLDIAAGSGLISASLQTRGFTNIDALEIDLHTLNTLQVGH